VVLLVVVQIQMVEQQEQVVLEQHLQYKDLMAAMQTIMLFQRALLGAAGARDQ
jgi:hypothetical protein